MHRMIVDELERHFSGNASRAFYKHLDECEECRGEIAMMDEASMLLRELRFDPQTAFEPPVTPRLGFYARVTDRIVEHQQKEAWGLFSPGAAFFRRMVFASLLLLAGLGSFLMTEQSSMNSVSGADAVSIMAQHDPMMDHTDSSDRDRMLVTLATYQP
jgi:hypothetical protein